MTALVLIGLIVACIKLWADVGTLRTRIRALELGSVSERRPTALQRPYRAEPHSVAPRSVVDPVTAAPEPAPVPQPPVPAPQPEPQPKRVGVAAPLATSRRGGFEDLFGRKLPIWAGGATLAVAGFLIVKYSIDAGLLAPIVRVVLGLLFGSALIAGAEVALRADARVRDPRVRQALSGAGVATLYASVLVAANLYHLIAPGTAFVGLTLTTLLAGGLSLRFGAPSAVLGLLGGLAAPALVGAGPPDVPLLSAYLALAVGGLCALSRAQRWMWLGVGALIGGFGWGALLILTGALNAADTLSIGALMLVLGVGLPVLAFGGPKSALVRAAGSFVACAQIAAVVAAGGFAPLQWGLFGLISIAILWMSRREALLRDLPVAGLTVALLLVAAWGKPEPVMMALVIGGIAAVYGAPAAWRVWRKDARLSDAGQIAAIAIGIAVLPALHLPLTDEQVSLLALLGASGTALVAALGWTCATRRDDVRFAVLTTTAAALLAIAVTLVAPAWVIAPVLALVGGALVFLANRADDRRVEASAWAFGFASLIALCGAPVADAARAVGINPAGGAPIEVLRWIVPALTAAWFAWRSRFPNAARIAQPLAVVLGYVAAAQIVPGPFVPVLPAVLLAGCAVDHRTKPAMLTAATIAAGWAIVPLGLWLAGVGGALFGIPLFVTALPTLADTVLKLMLAGIAAWFAATRLAKAERRIAGITAAMVLLVALHIGFKHLFAIADMPSFVRFGLAERTLWEAILGGAALAVMKRWPRVALVLAAAGVAHFIAFTAVLHNPLWAQQAVGPWPIFNLLIPAYGLAFVWLRYGAGLDLPLPVQRVRGWLEMALILLLAFSTLSQLFHGSVLAGGGVGEGEDIARSVLLIGLAIGFLRHGIVHAAHDWRIVSLLLMLLAVAKVFLSDAAGLEGLMRIASFAALGFSLIGIGWLYTRFLPAPAPLTHALPNADMSAEGE